MSFENQKAQFEKLRMEIHQERERSANAKSAAGGGLSNGDDSKSTHAELPSALGGGFFSNISGTKGEPLEGGIEEDASEGESKGAGAGHIAKNVGGKGVKGAKGGESTKPGEGSDTFDLYINGLFGGDPIAGNRPRKDAPRAEDSDLGGSTDVRPKG
ncbi:unnamed protein product, partial [Discosporangium mesarthrocarpum]